MWEDDGASHWKEALEEEQFEEKDHEFLFEHTEF
jgi:hypothetical protein